MKDIFVIKIGGLAGQGIKSAGQMLAKVATRSGHNIYTYTEFPSLIRGGHNATEIVIGKDEVTAPHKYVDMLISLNQDTLDKHAFELTKEGMVILDADKNFNTSGFKKGVKIIGVPLTKFASEAGGSELLINTVAVASAIAVLGGDLSIFIDLITQEYGDKGEELVTANKKAAESGYNFAKKEFSANLKDVLGKVDSEPKMIISGTDAATLGAIAGGLQFAAIYPMSPISGILHSLAKYQEKYGYIYKQPEDEISAINMSIGAGFAGARSMTATSGGGFSLMSEGYGLAAMTETPLVIIEGMRPGPATGLPTWSGQGDLQFLLHAHQGDFPRIVLAAGDNKEVFYLTMKAFNLADKYQTPVIVVVDKNLCDGDQSYPVFDISGFKLDRGKLTRNFDESFSRYKPAKDGISLRSIPGSGNFFIANSDEHDEEGFSSEDVDMVNKQLEKRMRKFETCMREDMESPQLIGPEDADVTIVSWGSNKGSIISAMKDFPNVNFLHITWMSPFPTERVKEVLTKAKYLIDVECNQTAQLANLIAEKTSIMIADKMLKYDGRPFFREEIVDKLNSVLKK